MEDKTFIAAAEIKVSTKLRMVVLDFRNATVWQLDLPPTSALAAAGIFRKKVKDSFGELSYDISTLPIKVSPNKETGMVESLLPGAAAVLAVNPELLLAWAEVMEKVALEMLKKGLMPDKV